MTPIGKYHMSKRRSRRSFGAQIEIDYDNKDINKTIELLSLSKEVCGSSQPQINPWR